MFLGAWNRKTFPIHISSINSGYSWHNTMDFNQLVNFFHFLVSTMEYIIASSMSCFTILCFTRRVWCEEYDCKPYLPLLKLQNANHLRYPFMPFHMVNNCNCEHCYHSWTLVSACCLDILDCCEVLSLTTTLWSFCSLFLYMYYEIEITFS